MTVNPFDVLLVVPPDLRKQVGALNRGIDEAQAALRDGGWRLSSDLWHRVSSGFQGDSWRQRADAALARYHAVVILAYAELDDATEAMLQAIGSGHSHGHAILLHCQHDVPRSQLRSALEVEDAVNSTGKPITGYGEDDSVADLLARSLYELATVLPVGRAAPADQAPPYDARAYLTCLAQRLSHVAMPGLSGANADRFELERLFVPPRFAPLAGGRSDRAGLGERAPRLRDVLRHRTLAVVGDPGAGKSTLLRYVALALAQQRLGQPFAGADPVGLELQAPLPVFVTLADLTEQLDDLGLGIRRSYTAEQWARVLDHQLRLGGAVPPEDAARELLQRDHVLWIFDGLDEVALRDRRERLAEAIAHLAALSLALTPAPTPAPTPEPTPEPRHRVVVSCRTVAWESGKAVAGFARATIEDFDLPAIARFATQWCSAYGEPTLAAGLIATVGANDRVRAIAVNPQMLTLLAVLYAAKGRLPEQRARLYYECVHWLTDKAGEALARYGGASQARLHLRALAVALHYSRDADGQPRDALTHTEAEAVLAPRVQALAAREGLDPRAVAEDLLHALAVHVGLVVDRGAQRHVAFLHRTFQEYLVACELAAATHPEAAFEAHPERIEDPHWLEVIALLAGELAGQEPRLALLLRTLVGPEAPPVQRAPRVGVAAYALRDLEAWGTSETVLAPVREALAQVMPILEDVRQQAPAEVRVAVARGLARTADPRLIEDHRWIEIPEGPFWRGRGEWPQGTPDADADDDESPAGEVWLSTYQLARWPVLVREYALFIERGGYENRSWWGEEGWQTRTEERWTAPDQWHVQRTGPSTHPVTGVSWWEARAYSLWADAHQRGRLGGQWRLDLPTEAQWEKAARGGLQLADGDANPEHRRRYPWQQDWNPDRCQWDRSEPRGVVPVGCHPAGHGPYGHWDLAGNAWEWCLDAFGPYAWWCPQIFLRNPGSVGTGNASRVLRGGGWRSFAQKLRVSCRGIDVPRRRDVDFGFRCVAVLRSP